MILPLKTPLKVKFWTSGAPDRKHDFSRFWMAVDPPNDPFPSKFKFYAFFRVFVGSWLNFEKNLGGSTLIFFHSKFCIFFQFFGFLGPKNVKNWNFDPTPLSGSMRRFRQVLNHFCRWSGGRDIKILNFHQISPSLRPGQLLWAKMGISKPIFKL